AERPERASRHARANARAERAGASLVDLISASSGWGSELEGAALDLALAVRTEPVALLIDVEGAARGGGGADGILAGRRAVRESDRAQQLLHEARLLARRIGLALPEGFLDPAHGDERAALLGLGHHVDEVLEPRIDVRVGDPHLHGRDGALRGRRDGARRRGTVHARSERLHRGELRGLRGRGIGGRARGGGPPGGGGGGGGPAGASRPPLGPRPPPRGPPAT